jgi:polygalacturonase
MNPSFVALTRRPFRALLIVTTLAAISVRSATNEDFSPGESERQLPRAMHSRMDERPRITVGIQSTDIIGSDHRALQAAVDYIAGLGGGTVEIGPGEFLMRDSLHLRSNVSVIGTPGRTILRKAKAAVSRLGLDGISVRNRSRWLHRKASKSAMASRFGTITRADFTPRWAASPGAAETTFPSACR